MAANNIAYGFVSLENVFAERVTTIGVQTIWDAINESAAEYNRQITALMSTMVARTTAWQERYKLPGTGTLQPLDQYGNPVPVREGGFYDIAYPIQGAGTAWGTDRVSRQLMTVQEANRQTIEALKRDTDWMRRHILAALFDNVEWTFADPEHGNLVIKPLANNDAVKYVMQGGVAEADNHYLAQASAIADASNPFPTIYDELTEHPANIGADIVCYIPSNLRASIEGLTAFHPTNDPNLVYADNVTTLRTQIDPGFGDIVRGYVDKVWIVEWKALPDNYMVAHARGAEPVVMQREYEAPQLQGLITENFSPDGALNETRLIRYCGFGVRNRVGALVMQIGNASYAIPTGYDAPLAV